MEKSQFSKSLSFFGSSGLAFSLIVQAGCGKSEFQAATEAASGIDANASRIIVPSTSVLADGLTPAPILIQLRDSKGRGISGISLVVSSSGTGNAMTVCPKTDSAGNSRCQMTSNVAELKNIWTIGKVTLSAKILFDLPVPATTLFSIVSSGDLQAVPSGHRILSASGTLTTVVDLKDSFGIKRFRSSHMGALLPME